MSTTVVIIGGGPRPTGQQPTAQADPVTGAGIIKDANGNTIATFGTLAQAAGYLQMLMREQAQG